MDKRVWTKEIGVWARTDEVQHTGLEVDLDRAGDIFGVGGFVEVDIDCRISIGEEEGRPVRGKGGKGLRGDGPLSSCCLSKPTYLPL